MSEPTDPGADAHVRVDRERRYPSSDALLAEAMQATGLSDFGPGDFREGLDVLLESLERDADLSPATDAAVIGDLRRRLVNRLEVEAWYRDHPEIEQLPVRGPVDINGLPRTGTTALANMMSLDPQFRCLRGWEQSKPCPPPTLEGEATDPRRLQRRRGEGAAPARAQGDAPLRRSTRRWRTPRCSAWRSTASSTRCPCTATTPGGAPPTCTATYDYHRRVVTAPAVAAPAGPLAVQGAAPQLPPRSDRRGLSRRPLRR